MPTSSDVPSGDEITCADTQQSPNSPGDLSFEPLGDPDWATLDSESPQSGQITIGRYKLMEPIGKGGMGVVWHAVQQEPVKRSVALKLVRAEAESKAIVARFEAERQAIAMMDHPNIASIYDAGTTADGSPYFVMELVKGMPFNKYCDKHKLSIRERLALFIPVCHAVQHAHQKGIIHRDLKHSNVLVTENDDKPVPKVIDFGLAKAQHQGTLTAKTLHTEMGKVVGTIQYMSPEQADSSGIDVDTRTDIYSLGVMLYKTLTGITPIQLEGEKLSVLGALKVVREKDPQPPSQLFRTRQERNKTVADKRSTTIENMASVIKGDLDAIVLKTLEKVRKARYETANGLAVDIQRFLNNEPVMARPVSTLYSIQKFVKRNRGLVSSLAIIAILLISGIIATSSAMFYAFSQQAIAAEQKILADKEAANALASERATAQAQKIQAKQLHSQLLKSAWSNWQLGNVESAWQTLRQITADNQDWVARHLTTEMTAAQQTLYGHARFVMTLDISPDGKYIVSGSLGDEIICWNATTFEKISSQQFDEAITSVRFSPTGDTFAVADRSNIVTIFDSPSQQVVQRIGPFPQDVSSLAFHPNGDFIAIGLFGSDSQRDGAARIYNEATKSPPDLKLVNLVNGKTIIDLKGHTKEVTSLVFSPDGQTLVSGSTDGMLRCFDISADRPKSSQLSQAFRGHRAGVHSVAISPDGQHILSGGYDKTAKLWSLETGEFVSDFVGHRRDVYGVGFSPDGEKVVTTSQDATAIVWKLNGDQIVQCRGHLAPINDAKFTPDGSHIITVSDDQTIKVWDASRSLNSFSLSPHEREVWCARVSPDGGLVATAGEDANVCLINTTSGKLMGKLEHDGAVLSLAFLSDNQLVTACADQKVHVWNPTTREHLHSFACHNDWIWELSFSPSKKLMITASSDGTAKVWRVADWALLATLEGHVQGLSSARFSPDESTIATASDDSSIRIWSVDEFKHVHTFDQNRFAVWRVSFCPNNPDMLASSGVDGSVKLWDVKNFKQIATTIPGHAGQVAGLAFTNDGRRLVTAGDDGMVRFWDVDSGIELFAFHGTSRSPMIHVSFSKNDNQMVTAGINKINVFTAAPNFRSPFLINDAVEIAIESRKIVTSQKSTQAEIWEIQKKLRQSCRCYPFFKSHLYLGIAQYRLGQIEDAKASLEEALRLERIEYGQPDLQPYIQAYLAMTYNELGQHQLATKMLGEFNSIADKFEDNEETQRLRKTVSQAIGFPNGAK